jgi:hypothetical protein
MRILRRPRQHHFVVLSGVTLASDMALQGPTELHNVFHHCSGARVSICRCLGPVASAVKKGLISPEQRGTHWPLQPSDAYHDLEINAVPS